MAAARRRGAGPSPAEPALSVWATAGKALFFDTSLSASGQQSCGTCHVASRAFSRELATDHGLPVPLGRRNMDLPGFRNAPSLGYAALTPPFSVVEGTPTDGFEPRISPAYNLPCSASRVPNEPRRHSHRLEPG